MSEAASSKDAPLLPSARLCLGTVQLGMRYGIANRAGPPDAQAVADLLTVCRDRGIAYFDTAEAYGESETVLSAGLQRVGLADSARIISKGTVRAGEPESLREKVSGSLSRLNRSALHGWMLHEEKQLDLWDANFDHVAKEILQTGAVGRFGVSCYHVPPALRGVENLGFRLLQVPANPMDRRFLKPEVLTHFTHAGATLFIRSVYLQGLCLMKPEEVPDRIPHARRAVTALAEFCARRELPRDLFCVHYVLQRTRSANARLVVGVDGAAQLQRCCDLLAAPEISPEHFDAWDEVWPDDLDDLILPYRWPKVA